ncbi:MAG: helix-turn-helix domain-containing protein [Paraclostridium sp.]
MFEINSTERKQIALEEKIRIYSLAGIHYEIIKDAKGLILDVMTEADKKVLKSTRIEKNSDIINDEDIDECEIWHGTLITNSKIGMPTHCLKDKKYCAREYGALMTISNKNKNEQHRYLYKNKFNTVQLAKDLGIGRLTLERNIKKLEKLDYNILEIENTKSGVVYKLKYGASKDEGTINKFVNINHKMLKTLVCAFNSNSIKLYCLFGYMTTETEFKAMDNKWLAEQIGLSSESKNNLDTITEIVAQLELCGFIETKKENIFKWDATKAKEVPQITKQYRLRTFIEWKAIQKTVK